MQRAAGPRLFLGLLVLRSSNHDIQRVLAAACLAGFSDQERKAIILALDALARSEDPNGERSIAPTFARKRL